MTFVIFNKEKSSKAQGKYIYTAIIVGVILVLLEMLSCGRTVPDKVREVIFEKSEFSVPITLTLPTEDDPQKIERLESEWLESRSRFPYLPPVFFGSKFQIDKRVLEILVRHGLASIKKLKAYSILGEQYETIVYSEKIRPYIYKGDFKFKKGKEQFEIKLASRTLKSIDYKNEYDMFGIKNFAVTFSYTLKKDFPYLEELVDLAKNTHITGLPFYFRDILLDKIYKGKAEAYLDPSTGQWEVGSITLEDKNPSAFKKDSEE